MMTKKRTIGERWHFEFLITNKYISTCQKDGTSDYLAASIDTKSKTIYKFPDNLLIFHANFNPYSVYA